jgi:hypothetical protein
VEQNRPGETHVRVDHSAAYGRVCSSSTALRRPSPTHLSRDVLPPLSPHRNSLLHVVFFTFSFIPSLKLLSQRKPSSGHSICQSQYLGPWGTETKFLSDALTIVAVPGDES